MQTKRLAPFVVSRTLWRRPVQQLCVCVVSERTHRGAILAFTLTRVPRDLK